MPAATGAQPAGDRQVLVIPHRPAARVDFGSGRALAGSGAHPAGDREVLVQVLVQVLVG
jgi:hypothetical protein